jgi:flagellar biosynthesis/type III secretory pathway protein FliH
VSGIIKSREALTSAQVKPMRFAPRLVAAPASASAEEPRIDPEVLALRREAEDLRRRLDEQQTVMEALSARAEQAYAGGEQHGRKVALEEADDGRTQRLVVLQTGVEQGLSQVGDALRSTEQLAVAIAREGLARVLGDDARSSDLMVTVIRTQLERIGAHTILWIEVSSADFQPEALEALRTTLGRPSLEIRANPELSSGDCRMKLTLGELHVGPAQQWRRLSAVLDELAATGDGR